MIRMVNMPRFFIDEPVKNFYEVVGENAYHIMKSLRMRRGEKLILCHNRIDYECEIVDFCADFVKVRLLNEKRCEAESQIEITLFQGLPKGDKMDMIVQKSVELGVSKIVPVFTNRCVSRPDEKSLRKKVERWQKIAQEAAKQSGRGTVPKILDAVSFEEAKKVAKAQGKVILFYEDRGISLKEALKDRMKSVSIFVGPEGGFEPTEVSEVEKIGGEICSLGKRILRTETAAIVATALVIYELERS